MRRAKICLSLLLEGLAATSLLAAPAWATDPSPAGYGGPLPPVQSVQPAGTAAPAPRAPAPLDVTMGHGGALTGNLVDHQGTPLAAWPVVLLQDNREVATATTDSQGHFTISGLRGGFYTVSGGEDARTCRLWAEGTAPPSAATGMQLYGGGDDATRGQMARLHSIYTSPLFIGGVVGGAIAVPLVLHNKQPSS